MRKCLLGLKIKLVFSEIGKIFRSQKYSVLRPWAIVLKPKIQVFTN